MYSVRFIVASAKVSLRRFFTFQFQFEFLLHMVQKIAVETVDELENVCENYLAG